MTGLDITAVASANQFIRSNLPAAAARTRRARACRRKMRARTWILTTASRPGSFSLTAVFEPIDLGDLTWNGELDLMCPTNRIGTVDLYLTSHHGLAKSGLSGARACTAAARCRDEQRHAQGRRAGRVPCAVRVAGSRGSLAVALVLQRGPRKQPGNVRRKHGGQRDDRRRAGAAASRARLAAEAAASAVRAHSPLT